MMINFKRMFIFLLFIMSLISIYIVNDSHFFRYSIDKKYCFYYNNLFFILWLNKGYKWLK